jgi:hypothetical protein
MLWIPPGFAHESYVTSVMSEFKYKCTDFTLLTARPVSDGMMLVGASTGRVKANRWFRRKTGKACPFNKRSDSIDWQYL